jgi:hypothetical protein
MPHGRLDIWRDKARLNTHDVTIKTVCRQLCLHLMHSARGISSTARADAVSACAVGSTNCLSHRTMHGAYSSKITVNGSFYICTVKGVEAGLIGHRNTLRSVSSTDSG